MIALRPTLGITPACAGKSADRDHHRRVDRDHPRVCGEKSTLADATGVNLRITPACAGKRYSRQIGVSYQ